MNNILAIVPARGGSKAIPKKNLVKVGGVSLTEKTLDEASKCDLITKIILSSDDEEILSIADRYKATALARPKELASDESTTEEVVAHALEHLAKSDTKFDWLLILQPTSFFRTARHISEAINTILEHGKATSLVSTTKFDQPLRLIKQESGGFLKDYLPTEKAYRRQDAPDLEMINGAIYIVKLDYFNQSKSLYSPLMISYVMSEADSVDIDNLEDLLVAEAIDKYRADQKERHA